MCLSLTKALAKQKHKACDRSGKKRKAEEAGDDEYQGDDEEEVVLIKLLVANPYASKPKKKQLAKVFWIADGSYKGTKTEVEVICIVPVMEEEEEVVMSVVKAVTAVVTTIKTT